MKPFFAPSSQLLLLFLAALLSTGCSAQFSGTRSADAAAPYLCDETTVNSNGHFSATPSIIMWSKRLKDGVVIFVYTDDVLATEIMSTEPSVSVSFWDIMWKEEDRLSVEMNLDNLSFMGEVKGNSAYFMGEHVSGVINGASAVDFILRDEAGSILRELSISEEEMSAGKNTLVQIIEKVRENLLNKEARCAHEIKIH